ncbi:hypothetical protein PFISCL1PPCAC_11266, partial [Pristionchus fissidentatus]
MGTQGTVVDCGMNDGGGTAAVERGIVCRSAEAIFDAVHRTPGEFRVSLSIVEVYGSLVRDLLEADGTKRNRGLEIREKDGEPFVKDLSIHEIDSVHSMFELLHQGNVTRAQGATAMNLSSSRSHAVYTIHLQKLPSSTEDRGWESKLRLVDLAGSERFKATKAEGTRKKEGIKINEGLHAIGMVIKALATDGSKHVPYRGSKITRLLQDSLGGSSYTVMIACASPSVSNEGETLSTLRYVDMVKSIKNTLIVPTEPPEQIIKRQRAELVTLRRQLDEYRRREETAETPATTPPSVVETTSGECCVEWREKVERMEEMMEKMRENEERMKENEERMKENEEKMKENEEKMREEEQRSKESMRVELEREREEKERLQRLLEELKKSKSEEEPAMKRRKTKFVRFDDDVQYFTYEEESLMVENVREKEEEEGARRTSLPLHMRPSPIKEREVITVKEEDRVTTVAEEKREEK